MEITGLFSSLPLAFNLGMPELVVIMVVILLLFGGTKIPQLMRGLGRGAGEFQKGLEESKKTFEKLKSEATTPSQSQSEEEEDKTNVS